MGARAFAVALPLQEVEGGRCQAARAPGFMQWEPGEQGGWSSSWDVMGLEPAPNLEAVGSPPPRALRLQGMMRPPGKCAALGLVRVREGGLASARGSRGTAKSCGPSKCRRVRSGCALCRALAQTADRLCTDFIVCVSTNSWCFERCLMLLTAVVGTQETWKINQC